MRGKGWDLILEGALDGHRHVVPVRDLRPHVEDVDCWCEPKLEGIAAGRLMVTHNAADGRELVERHGLQ